MFPGMVLLCHMGAQYFFEEISLIISLVPLNPSIVSFYDYELAIRKPHCLAQYLSLGYRETKIILLS